MKRIEDVGRKSCVHAQAQPESKNLHLDVAVQPKVAMKVEWGPIDNDVAFNPFTATGYTVEEGTPNVFSTNILDVSL